MLENQEDKVGSGQKTGSNYVKDDAVAGGKTKDRGSEIQSLIEIDRKLHWLSQVLAKTHQTFVPDKPDHSHINLYFDALANRIDGRWIDIGRERLMLTINLKDQSLEWLNSHREIIYRIETIGKTMATIESELVESFPIVGLNKNEIVKELYYQAPEYGFTTVEPIKEKHLRQWRMHRRLANNLASLVLGYLDIEGEIRISPKYFNTKVFSVFNDQMEFKFGLAMENSIIGCPYFYLTGNPVHGHIDYEDLPKMIAGKWIIGDHWKGAVLPIDELRNGKYDKNKDKINSFLIESIDWYASRYAHM